VIVNVASKWGVTDSEYKALNQLYSDVSSHTLKLYRLLLYVKYASKENGLRILAFPCNQFGKQEPGTDADIKAFADGKGFQGDLFQKIDVNGKNAHPLFTWMKKQKNGRGTLGDDIKWNFTKFLIDQTGQVVCREGTTTNSAKLAPRIEKLLEANSPF